MSTGDGVGKGRTEVHRTQVFSAECTVGATWKSRLSVIRFAIPSGSTEEGRLEEGTDLEPTEDALALDPYSQRREWIQKEWEVKSPGQV